LGSGRFAARELFAVNAHEIHMLDVSTNHWLSRLQSNAPRTVAFVLAALIVLELGRVAFALVSNPVKSPQPATPLAAANNARPGVNVQDVVNAHLFGVAVADPGSQDPANAPPSSANLMLTGTIATQDPKHGVAIVSDAGGPSRVYSVGDRLAGASLHSVYLDHVILDRNGALETVTLPRLLPAGSVAAPGRRPAGDPRTAAAVDNIRRMVQQDPSILDQVMRTVPSFDSAAGKLRGFRAFPGRNRQIFSKLGLKSGDLVTAINGTQLDDPQRSQEVFNTIQTSDHVTVTVERGGQKQDISLNIAQVAAQATQELDSGQNGAGSAQPSTAPPVPNDAQTAPSSPPPDAETPQRPVAAPPLPTGPPPGTPPSTPPSNDNANQ
jgi:general secretion pathway protein C